ncbi:MAG: YdbH domain-containing protein [Chakrabartia sp.]
MVWKRKSVRIAAALGGLSLIALVVAWTQREPIARDLIDNSLTDKGVAGRYTISAIGTQKQRLENVSLGDPQNPDLTADWAEIDTGLSLSGVTVKAVRAGGVRLRGRLVDGVVSFGAVDKLLPKPTGVAFSLPDIDVTLRDARLQLSTPHGAVGATLDGRGNLTHGFRGKIAVAAPRLAQTGCVAERVTLYGDISVSSRRPAFKGPVRLATLNCAGVRANQATMMVDASVAESMDRWTGTSTFSMARSSGFGADARNLSGTITFGGTPAASNASVSLTAKQIAAPKLITGNTHIVGNFDVRRRVDGGYAVDSSGTIDTKGLAPDRALLSELTKIGGSGSGTPAAPLTDALAKAFGGLARGSIVSSRYILKHQNGQGQISLSALKANSTSGAFLTTQGETPIIVRWPGGVAFSGHAQISGGGFPLSKIQMQGTGGTAVIAPFVARGARLITTPVRFNFGRKGLTLDTVVTLDGPLGSGRVSGLKMPIALRPGRSLLTGCLPTQFQSLILAGLRLSPARFSTCISGKDARIAKPRLTGYLGQSPILLAANSARIGFSRGDFSVNSLAVRLGEQARLSLLTVGSLSGTLQSGGAKGRFTGTSGQIGTVPLRLSEGNGSWALTNSVLTLNGGLRIADAAPEARFQPLIAEDFALRLKDGLVNATATAREPASRTAISNITIAHSLSSGTGHAVLDVPSITFGPKLQPETLTTITLGVIANVQGRIAGRGQINWTPNTVTSTGGFHTDGIDLAAAFGPVTGLKGEIMLSDLLGLETGPGQRITIAGINPGIAVSEGEISYRLLPGLKAEIEGGRWPFAGGALILEPTILDLSESAERRLTFRVEGVDAARFIASLEFENIAATGIFDGTLPMIFDKNGGRIEGGKLIARGGGTLAYVGEISNENLGLMGRFAFDALKSIKYDRLSIDLGGAIDGDIVTKISFAGVNQAPISGVRTKLPIKIYGLTNIPFIFNVTITAPFRQLFEMTRSFNDPSLLIERMVPSLKVPNTDKPVQQKESDPVR